LSSYKRQLLMLEQEKKDLETQLVQVRCCNTSYKRQLIMLEQETKDLETQLVQVRYLVL
jgi:hypothetical protein